MVMPYVADQHADYDKQYSCNGRSCVTLQTKHTKNYCPSCPDEKPAPIKVSTDRDAALKKKVDYHFVSS